MQKNYYSDYKSPKSPRKFTYADQRSPKVDYDDGNVHYEAPRSPKITYSNGDNSYGSPISSKATKSPNSSKKFVFDAVSPRSESEFYVSMLFNIIVMSTCRYFLFFCLFLYSENKIRCCNRKIIW